MSRFVAVSAERHAAQRWQRFSSYEFARSQTLVELVAVELPKAAVAMPIALVRADAGYRPAALLGLEPTQNLYVAADGRWLGRYVPALLRSHPFCLLPTGAGQQVLGVDEASGLVGASGEPFFVAGQIAPALSDVISFLQQIEANRQRTIQACAALEQAGLIAPWPITVHSTDGERRIAGLHRIDEAALGHLPADTLVLLRDVGALALAYCQLLSMQQLALLGELSAAHKPAVSPRENDFFLGDDGGTLYFGEESAGERT